MQACDNCGRYRTHDIEWLPWFEIRVDGQVRALSAELKPVLDLDDVLICDLPCLAEISQHKLDERTAMHSRRKAAASG